MKKECRCKRLFCLLIAMDYQIGSIWKPICNIWNNNR